MQITITYIHHNCFVMATDDRTFLFDYPADTHLPDGAESRVRELVAGTDLAVFVSHSHEDHLNDDLVTMASLARSTRYILSDDVEDMRPDVIPGAGDVLVVEPDETYEFDGMIIDTLMSNDLGVAFLVKDGDFRFYYGGDLAKWIWKSAPDREQSATASFFRQAMETVQSFRPHVAFSNVDKRLENLAGGAEAYRETGAEVFVPMHTFGDTGYLPRFREQVGQGETRLFIYAKTGDAEAFSF